VPELVIKEFREGAGAFFSKIFFPGRAYGDRGERGVRIAGDIILTGRAVYLRSGAFPAIRADNPAAEPPARPFLNS